MSLQSPRNPRDLFLLVRDWEHKQFKDFIESETTTRRLARLNVRNESGETVLHQLARTKWQDQILWFLDPLSPEHRIAILGQAMDNGKSVLHLLAENAENEELLLIKSIFNNIDPFSIPDLLTAKSNYGDTVLHLIVKARRKAPELVKDILRIIPTDVEERDSLLMVLDTHSFSVVHHSAANNDVALTAILLDACSKSNRLPLLKLQNRTGRTALHNAVEHNNLDLAEVIVKSVTDDEKLELMSVRTKSNLTAYELAMSSGYTALMRVLDPNNDVGKCSTLHRAAEQNSPASMRCLLEQMDNDQLKLDKLCMKDNYGRTALHLAVKSLNMEMVQCILSPLKQRDKLKLLSITDVKGETVFHTAIQVKCPKILIHLIHCLNIDRRLELLHMPNVEQHTVLHLAVAYEELGLIRIIIESVKEFPPWTKLLFIRDESGMTPLQQALEGQKALEVAQYMLHSCTLQERLHILSESSPSEATAILDCMKLNESEAVELVTLQTKTGDSFLHLAVRAKHFESVRRYLNLLTDRNRNIILVRPNKEGLSPRQLAKQLSKDLPKDPTLKILKSFLCWAEQQQGVYYLPSPPLMIIICNTQERNRAEDEKQALMKAVPGLNVHCNDSGKDLTADEILLHIKMTIAQHDDDISGLIVVIMAHGEKGSICAKDFEPLRLQDILITMDVPQLKRKPKCLVVQACQSKRAQQNDYVPYPPSPPPRGGSMSDPTPPPQPVQPPVVSQENRQHFSQLNKHFYKHASYTTVPDVPEQLISQVVPANADIKQKTRVRAATLNYVRALHELNLALAKPHQAFSVDMKASDTDSTHFDVQQRDIMTLMSTVNGGSAQRCELIPTLAKFLETADDSEGMHDIFLKTHCELEEKLPNQVLEFRSTLTKKFCLKTTFKAHVDYTTKLKGKQKTSR